MADTRTAQREPPAWAEMVRVFGRIGLLSFGGPAAQIAVMHRELVDERPLLQDRQFLNALSFCMLLPGPEAMQLATYAGWRLRGVAGGILAGLLFVLPGALVMLALAAGYVALGRLPAVQGLFLGIKATVVVIVAVALLRVARKALDGADRWVIAALAFVAIFAFAVPFPWIIVAAAVYGAATATAGTAPAAAPPAASSIWRTVFAWAALWAAPLVLAWTFGARGLFEIGLFFSKLAIVTFGGAYAVLAYMAQAVVQDYGWLDTATMMDGLGLAETTPGPLILVTEFVGFIAGFGLAGWAGAMAGAAMTLWVTFVPCFLWIFAGAPYLDWVTSRPRLRGALSAITAAVVGVILNLALWFAIHVFFGQVSSPAAGLLRLPVPDPATIDWRVVLIAAAAAVALLRLNWGLFRVLGGAALAGLALATLG